MYYFSASKNVMFQASQIKILKLKSDKDKEEYR